jgi:hypothetical protein
MILWHPDEWQAELILGSLRQTTAFCVAARDQCSLITSRGRYVLKP